MDAPGSGVPDVEWKKVLTIYSQRADVDRHLEAARQSAALAAANPSDSFLQLFAARTAYYCAHRLKDSRVKRGVALAGVEAANRLLALDPGNYDGRYWHALNTFRARESEGLPSALKGAREARGFLEEMRRTSPHRFEAYMLLGVFYRELPPLVSFGDKKKALRLLEQGTALAPRDPEMLLELAAAYRKVGRKKESRATYERVIHDSDAGPYGDWEAEDARVYARKQLRKLFF